MKAEGLCIFFVFYLLTGPLRSEGQNIAAEAYTSINPATCLWYTSAAKKWEEALPVGNGRLGAMVFGNPREERIQLNEDTYWTGGPYSTVVKGGYKHLHEIQKLVFEQKYLEAHKSFGRHLMGYPVEQQKYQSLANLHLFFKNKDSITEYKRWLDLEKGLTGVEYTSKGITYRREVFASAPDQVIIVRITASEPGSISFTANLRGVRNQAHSNYATDYFRMDPVEKDGLVVTGKSADYLGIEGRLKYEARLKVLPEGGSITTKDVDLIVEHADAVTLYIVAATNFVNYKDVSANQHQRVENHLNNLKGRGFEELKNSAISDYAKFFSRVSVSLPVTPNSYLPTDDRIQQIQSSPDPGLAALFYNFGRYLLISCSRPGTQAANLQGIWNDDMNPAWDSKYTTNINLEMNYWPVETGNLSEMAEPLIQLVKDVTDQGSQVAREHYGARGWVLHQNTDLWKVAAPMDGPAWGTFTTGGAWLCTNLWEHFLFTMDRKYLEDIYPVMEGSIQFFMDFLVMHPNGKWLVTNPSTSPENFPDAGNNGPFFDEVTGGFPSGTTICAGSSIDMQILHDFFGYFLEASKTLNKHSELTAQVISARAKLTPPQIGADGTLQEWSEDWKSLEKNHRHISHLYGLYPGLILWEKRTPALLDSYKKLLNNRGDGATGWSRAWKMGLWARLQDGNRVNKIFKRYLKEQSCLQFISLCGREPQVDGTFGTTAAIGEMLVQSHEGFINFIPALPDEWDHGEVKGMRARGAFEVDFKWTDGKLNKAAILSKEGMICKLKIAGNFRVKSNGKKVRVEKNKEGIIEFPTIKGHTYLLERG